MPRIAVAVSGGADSLFSLVALKEQGHDIMALHGRFLPFAPGADPVPALRVACEALGVPLHVLELAETFDRAVAEPFVRDYARGKTPNPCALCNARIKFGVLMDAALQRGATILATGHYAALRSHPRYGRVLSRAADHSKDQSYFLTLVPRARLERACFPMAEIHKKDAVAALAARGMAVPLPRESQEICFVPDDRYRPYVEEECARRGIGLGGPGSMLLHVGTPQERALGRHEGLWRYTEGQRRGLGVPFSEPLYVTGKDHGRNALLLGTRRELALRGCRVEHLNMLVPRNLWPEALWARVRYRQDSAPAEAVVNSTETCMEIRFATPQSPTAPGQIAAVFDDDGVALAGGIISELL